MTEADASTAGRQTSERQTSEEQTSEEQTSEQRSTERTSSAQKVRGTLRKHRGWAGFTVGGAVGALLALLVPAVLPWPAAPPERPEPGTIWILSGADASPGGQRQALIDQWNKIEGRPKARIVPVSGGADAEHAQMVAAAQAGGESGAGSGADGPDLGADRIDIYNLDVPLMAEFIEFEYIRPLDAARVDRTGFLDGPLGTCERDGELWGLPFNTDAAMLYHRSDLLGGNTPPTSWAGLRNQIQEIFADRTPEEVRESSLTAGYAGQLADYEGLSVNAFEAIWAAGGEVVDAEGNVVIDSDEARDGLRRLANWLMPGNPQLMLPEVTTFKEDQTTQAFRDGQVVFMRNWPVEYGKLVNESGEKAIPFEVSPLPGPGVLGGQNLAIATSSDQPRAAQELIEFLTGPRSQQILFERGGFAATREIVYHDATIQDKYGYAPTLLTAIRQARRRPDTPYYPLFSEVFREGVRYALAHDGELPDGFTDQLADALKGIKRD